MSEGKKSLPSSWLAIELRDLTAVSYGKALAAGVRAARGRVPVVGSSGIVGYHNEELVDGACLVVGRKGAAGSVHLVRESSWPIDTAYFIQPPRDIDLVYLSLFLGVCELGSLDKSTAIPSLSRDDLYRVRVSVAPRAEQVRIVEKLEELLSDLDAGVAELKAAQKKLAQYRQSLLKAAVEGALTAEWRKHHQPSESGAQVLERILAERRARWEARQLAKFKEQGKVPPKDWQKKYPEPARPLVGELPALPPGWAWASVQQLGDVQLGRQRSPDKVMGLNPVPYIRAANITEAGIDLCDILEMDFSSAEVETFGLEAGDVLLTEASGSAEHVGRPAIWRETSGTYCFQNTVLRFRPRGVSPEFGFISFLAMQKLGVFRRLSGGVGINHLSAGKFSSLAFALPPSIEQDVLATRLGDLLNQCSRQENEILVGLKRAAAQRQNILRAAFSGQLVPQDPNDEPASALLERIRAERAAQDEGRTRRGRPAAAKRRVRAASAKAPR